jgi:hypothetical protein
MFTCHPPHHRGQGKHHGQPRGRGKRCRDVGPAYQRPCIRAQWGKQSVQSGTDEKRAANVAEAAEASSNLSCPLCKNHCLLSAPGCPKGEAFAQSIQVK